ncbi:MAG: hypothetical protein ACOC2R_06270 [Spirochaetota bacterium]
MNVLTNGIDGRLCAGSLFVLLIVLSAPLGAIDFSGAEVDYSLRIIGSQQDDLESGSTGAVWTNVLAARFPILLENENFAIVPGVSFTSMYYRYDATNERAVPTDVEWRELTALVPVLDFTFRWQFLKRSWGRIAAESGIGFHLPVPLKSWTTGAGSEENAGKITPALYSGVQFVLPEVALQANWPVSEKFEIITRVSGYIPVYRLWDGKGLPLSDGLMTGLHIGAFFPY